MNDPVRLQKAGSTAAKTLLAAGQRDVPSPFAQHMLLGALGIVVAAPPTPTPARASLWRRLKHSAWVKVGIGVVVSGLVVHAIDTRAPAFVAAPETLRSVPVPPVAVPSPVTHPLVMKRERAVPPAKKREAAPRTSLAQELAAIVSVREAIAANDGAAALHALDAYEQAYEKGVFAEEALALRVRALRLTGDDAAAARALDTLRIAFPESVHMSALER
jgi:hypothetical protein